MARKSKSSAKIKAKTATKKQKRQRLKFQYDGAAFNIWRPMTKYAFFNLITLFIYRFWAKTHLRRYFWSSAQLNKASFAYHGTGKELFFGALAVLGIFIIYYIVDYIASLIIVGNVGQSAAYGGLVFVIFLFLLHFAVYRMLRYRLTRTSWRGVRFNLEGEALRYACWGLLLSLADWLSLRLAHPWVRSYLINYRLRRMRFGNRAFDSELSGRRLMVVYYLALAPALIGFALLGALFGAIASDILSTPIDLQDGDAIRDRAIAFLHNNYGGLWLGGIALSFIANWAGRICYRFFEAKTVISHLRFLKIRFTGKLAVIKTAFIYMALRIGFYIGLAILGGISYFLNDIHVLLGLAFIYPIYLYYYFFSVALLNWVVAKLISASSLSGDTSALQDVSAYRDGEPTRGEGWFELLDIGNL